MAISFREGTYSVVYLITVPCFFAHLGIIFSILILPRYNKSYNYLVANLSLGTILNQLSMGILIVERHVSLGPLTSLCGQRAIFFRYGMAIITFTLTALVLERSYISRNPISRPSTRGRHCSPSATALLINLLSLFILLPVYFCRKYDPSLTSPLKCVKVFLWGSIHLDFFYRIFLLLTLQVIPAFTLFLELRKIRRLMHSLDPPKCENPVDHGVLTRHRLRLMRNSCFFIFAFVSFSIPFGILDTFDNSNVYVPQSWLYYFDFLKECVLLYGYTVITACTVGIVYFNRLK